MDENPVIPGGPAGKEQAGTAGQGAPAESGM